MGKGGERLTPIRLHRLSSSKHRARHLRPLPQAVADPSGIAPSKPSSAGTDALVQVVTKEEALTIFTVASADAEGEVQLNTIARVPLLTSLAYLHAENPRMVILELPTSESVSAISSMMIAPPDEHSRFQGAHLLPPGGERVLRMECATAKAARRLMLLVSMAGATLRGLVGRYRLRKQVGVGGFGKVYLAVDTWFGQEVAIKVFLKQTQENFHPLREAVMLRQSQHPAFPEFKGVYQVIQSEQDELGLEDGEGIGAFAMVTEYLPGGELFDFIGKYGALPEEIARAVVVQVLEGLRHLHENGVMHRDVKPENILLTGCGNEVKLVDFGLACPVWDEKSNMDRVGSVGFVAPEVLRRPASPQRTAVDMFSAGVLLYTCLAGHGPFQGRTAREVLIKNLRATIDVRELSSFPKGARDLILKLMSANPEERPSVEKALQHPWLQEPDELEVRRRVSGDRQEASSPESIAPKEAAGVVTDSSDPSLDPSLVILQDAVQDSEVESASSAEESITEMAVKAWRKRRTDKDADEAASSAEERWTGRATAGDRPETPSQLPSSLSLFQDLPPHLHISQAPDERDEEGPDSARGGGAFAARLLRTRIARARRGDGQDTSRCGFYESEQCPQHDEDEGIIDSRWVLPSDRHEERVNAQTTLPYVAVQSPQTASAKYESEREKKEDSLDARPKYESERARRSGSRRR